ncbi:indolepyruvate oxidoreductase subunit beta [Calderihabitans maritimus]|uniref:Indolepyruvate ferredoxin oxidoreductase n=1 Tax=Calderihabitans maritimus TaxID=1246530 RepID=A0A1Z5HSX2_9FIRM|nr:indolepyruvate oxidoreductase subunit beta [Calderihabitans maritimus]GAW92538.1 Indolepyruvate ferredoxin oxidoreductase [Calderihabitans maritimus]
MVLASRIIAQTAMKNGWQVRTSEIHGMAQRGGAVTSHVRIGKNLFGALIPNGAADILLGFELAETVRGLEKLKAGGKIIANSAKVVPVSVTMGKTKYPDQEILQYLKKQPYDLTLVDAHSLALKAGHYKAVNMVLLGVLAAQKLPFAGDGLLSTALELLPAKLHEVNVKAFYLGKQTGEGYYGHSAAIS